MKKLIGLPEAEVKKIGRLIGESYYAEDDPMTGIFESKEDCIKYFTILTQMCMEAGILYTISDDYEGFAAFYTKKNVPYLAMLKMLVRLMRSGLMPALKKFGEMHKGWVETNKKYKKEDNFIEVYMACVPVEHQGKGYLHQLLEMPFMIARENKMPCIIETNTDLKAAKYQRCGLAVSDRQEFPSGVVMYSLEYRGKGAGRYGE